MCPSATMSVLPLHKRVSARMRAAKLLARAYETICSILKPYFCQVKAFDGHPPLRETSSRLRLDMPRRLRGT